MISKSKVLEEGNVEYYSAFFDMYFVSLKTKYNFVKTPCIRLNYFTLVRGRGRRSSDKLIRCTKEQFKEKLKTAKMWDSKRIKDKSKLNL